MKRISFFAALLLLFATSCSQKPEVIQLFNGKDLEGWTLFANDPAVAASDVFSVVDGNIRIAGQPFGFMRTNEKYTDVVFRAEWRWVGEGSNSGIFSLVPGAGIFWFTSHLVSGEFALASASGFVAIKAAVGIVLGIILAMELPQRLFSGRQPGPRKAVH